ncbi:MAG: hypothetical protein HYX91_02970 [Chloroflexi bacterium]|nr:hypothetical protein [Chloroflexota bacterium]
MAGLFESNAVWIIWGLIGVAFLVFMVLAPCHAVFLTPFVGLPLFWLMPLISALSIYLVILLVSALLYLVMIRALRQPVRDDFRSLVGARAEVVSTAETNESSRYLVRCRGELWSAYCDTSLDVGEQVRVAGVKGVGVVVEPCGSGTAPVTETGRECH